MSSVGERSTATNLFIDQMQQWLTKNSKKFHAIDRNCDVLAIGKTLPDIRENINSLLHLLLAEVQKIEASSSELDKTNDSLTVGIPNERVLRIKPKVKKTNASGQEVYNEFEEEDIPNESTHFITIDEDD